MNSDGEFIAYIATNKIANKKNLVCVLYVFAFIQVAG
jgi:hypothetical protein